MHCTKPPSMLHMITAFFTQVLPLGWAVPHFKHNNTLDGVCLVSVLSGFLCLLVAHLFWAVWLPGLWSLPPCFFFSPFLGWFLFMKFGRVSSSVDVIHTFGQVWAKISCPNLNTICHSLSLTQWAEQQKKIKSNATDLTAKGQETKKKTVSWSLY